jgi:C1A family cysteine protease
MTITNKYSFNLKKSPDDTRDFMLESIYPEPIKLPEVWDLRPQMRPIRDQGTQGTCSAQTVSAMKEWQENLDVKLNDYMSPQFIYNLRSNKSTDGMTPKDTMEILYKIGIVPEKIYPYNTSKNITESQLKLAESYKIQGYARINTVDSLKKALFANGPCYIAFPVYNPDNIEFWKPEFQGQQLIGGHAVCVAGYLKDKFIIRNSWSSSWGDNGYTYLPFTEWGMQWECWTAIDADSNSEKLKNKALQISYADNKSFFRKLFHLKLKK